MCHLFIFFIKPVNLQQNAIALNALFARHRLKIDQIKQDKIYLDKLYIILKI